jgi:NAD-dependent deacetylase
VVAKRNGATLIIVSREPTAVDEVADLVLNLEIGATLGAAVGVE